MIVFLVGVFVVYGREVLRIRDKRLGNQPVNGRVNSFSVYEVVNRAIPVFIYLLFNFLRYSGMVEI